MSKGSDNISIKKEKKVIFLLTCIQFFNILDFVVIMPLAPMLMREYNISPTQFAVLASSYSISAGAIALAYSAFADRFNRKSALLVSIAGFTVATSLCVIAPTYTFLLVSRIIAGLFGGILTPSSYAIVSDVVPPSRRGSALGALLATFSITSIIGIPAGLAVADTFGWRYTFALISSGSFIIFILTYIMMPSFPVHSTSKNIKETFNNIFYIMTNKDHFHAYMSITLFSSAGFVLFPFLSAYCTKKIGLLESDLKYIYLSGGLLTIITSRYLGKLTDRYNPIKITLPALLISYPVILLYTSVENMQLPALLIISTLFMASINGRFVPIMTLITQAPKPENRGAFMGVLSSVRAFASGLSTMIAGLIIVESPQGKLLYFDQMGYYSILITVIGMYFVVKLKKQVGSQNEAIS